MSVINSMLKNIEQRQPNSAINDQGTVVVEPVYDSHGAIKKVVTVAVALLVVVLSYIYLPSTSEKVTPPVSTATQVNKQHQLEAIHDPAVLVNENIQKQSDIVAPPVAQFAPTLSEPELEGKNEVKPEVKESFKAEKVTLTAATVQPQKTVAAKQQSTIEVKKVTQPRTEQQQIADLLRQAKQALEFGLYQEGINDLTQILSRDKGNIAARSLLAATYFQQQDILSAQSILEHGIAFDSQVLEWRVLLSKIYITRKQYAVVQQLLSDEFDSQGDAQYWALKGTAAQQLGDHTRALTCFEQLTQLQPQQGKWWLAMATSKDAQGDYLSAKRYYQAAIDVGNLNFAVLKHAEQRLQALGGVS
ncbi:agglutinin biogenesis protein MshN [Pseudoalteromonas shioyasakiensis]|uniref:tetratricopeptide repeat protein n=1 Tax=Pseudoalteromonas shioyasakiensis TaxID=1190813 RepID=UPI0021197BFE|nr:tetratricopeptide repeat protein [Pseudoalteromonas shioyasakiensis]MCQ8879160.1 agglutinin biogenesis protein MshN [Pseudoalteromonas shioyasakiensis]